MKIIFTFIMLFLFLVVPKAQKPITLTEDSVSFRSGKYPGIVVTIPEASYETVAKNWQKEIESGTKSKAVYENGEWSIFGANLKSIAPYPVNVYSKLVSQDTLVKLMVSCELKKDVYIQRGSSDAELATAKTYLKDFAREQYLAVAEGQLKAEKNKLDDLEKELSSLEKDEENLEKAIRSAENTISSENDNLGLLDGQLTNLNTEILSQNTQVAAMEEGSAKEERMKYLQDLEKKKKKLQNDKESSEKKINRANKEIEDSRDEIPGKQSLQDEVKRKIVEQEKVVARFESKVEAISAY
jgi:septal ring factor EnvC (AmiA/AmiB activator)